jgi:hypothetical protein
MQRPPHGTIFRAPPRVKQLRHREMMHYEIVLRGNGVPGGFTFRSLCSLIKTQCVNALIPREVADYWEDQPR